MDIIDIIKSRHSVRTYSEQEISSQHWEIIKEELKILENGYGVKLSLLKNDCKGKQFGTYGIIKNPDAYIVIVCKNKKDSLIQVGVSVEKAILHCVTLGIGSCWLAGTLNRDEFGSAITVDGDEIMPAVVALGYPTDKERAFAKFMRFAVKADKRKPFETIFFENEYDKLLSMPVFAEKTAIDMVRLAPSASNKQPWRIVKVNETYHFFLAHTKDYKASSDFDVQIIDMGIAMAHFELVMQSQNCNGQWQMCNPQIKNVPSDVEYIMSWVR